MTDCNKDPCMLAQVDAAIEQIESVKKFLDDAFKGLEKATQEKIDEVIVNNINPMVNAKLAGIRATLLSSLQEQYAQFSDGTSTLQPIYEATISNITNVISFCKQIQAFICGAYTKLLEFTGLLITHIARLTTAITDIVSYTPPMPNINFDKLDIQMQPITLADITGGNDES